MTNKEYSNLSNYIFSLAGRLDNVLDWLVDATDPAHSLRLVQAEAERTTSKPAGVHTCVGVQLLHEDVGVTCDVLKDPELEGARASGDGRRAAFDEVLLDLHDQSLES